MLGLASAAMRRWRYTIVVVVCSVAAAACASFVISLPASHLPPVDPSSGLLVGAARIEITPIVGMPMGGHSRAGQIARGYWSRLYARAIYVEGSGAEGFVLVSADLWSIPSGLSDRVAELLADRLADGRVLGREQIVIAATHTHHSPGGYSTDRFFAAFGATRGGFDSRLFEYLAGRIAVAVQRAVETRIAARASMSRARTAAVVRNRSIEPFLANPEAAEILRANRDLPLCTPSAQYPRPEACRAVDPSLAVVSFEHDAVGRRGELIAAAVFFAVHPTVISNQSALYSADLFGAVAIGAERAIAKRSPDSTAPVVALFNGAEGDVSATWTGQNRADVLRLSAQLVPLVERLALGQIGAARDLGNSVSLSFDRMRLDHRRVVTPGGKLRRTARMPMAGRGTLGGAEDGRTDFPGWLSHEGLRGAEIGAHGTKIGAFDLVGMLGFTLPPFYLTRLVGLAMQPEHRVSIGVYTIGDLHFATLPGEFTTVMGRRIREEVASNAGVGLDQVLAIGLAQSYAYYFTTPEEYDLQHYEGSGMLFGKYAGTFLKTRIARLAGDGRRDRLASHRSYHPGIKASFGPRLIDTAPHILDSHTDDIAAPTLFDQQPARLPQLCWRGSKIAWAQQGKPGASVKLSPRAHVEQRIDGHWQALIVAGEVQNDEGLRFLTLGDGDGEQGSRWCSYWIPPRASASDGVYRLAVSPRDYAAVRRYADDEVAVARCDDAAHMVYSPAFRLDSAPLEADLHSKDCR